MIDSITHSFPHLAKIKSSKNETFPRTVCYLLYSIAIKLYMEQKTCGVYKRKTICFFTVFTELCVRFSTKKSLLYDLIFAPKILGIPNILTDSEREHDGLL